MSRSELKEAKSAGLPKKPKKSSTFAIYDALKANQSLHSISSSSHQPVKGLHTNAARWNEVLLPKSFVMKKKRGKKLSTFKKKILMERLRVSIKLRVDALGAQDTPAHASVGAPKESADLNGVPIHVFNFVEDADLSDEAELLEIVANMKELLQPVGEVIRIRILYARTGATAHVEVTFTNGETADKAIAVIKGLVCGGQQLLASRNVVHVPTSCASFNPTKVEITPQGLSTDPNGTLALYLFNMVSSEVLEDAEEAQEVLSDVLELCGVFGAVKKVWIEKRETAPRLTDISSPVISTAAHTSGNMPWAAVCFSHIQNCIESAQNAATHTVAGCPLAAYLYNYDAYQCEHFHPHSLIALDSSEEECVSFAIRLLAFCNVEELQGDEEREEMFDNVRSLVNEACAAANVDQLLFVRTALDETSVDIIVLVTSLDIAATVYAALSCRIMGGQPLQADILHLAWSTTATPLRPQEPGTLHSYDPHEAIADFRGIVVAHTARVCSPQGAAVLVVQNYFSAEDLEECREAEVAEMKQDLLTLCACPSRGARAATEGDSFVHRVHVVREQSQFVKSESGVREPSAEAQYVAGVEFALPSHAQDAMLHLDERIIGGAELTARVARRDLTSSTTVFAEVNTAADQAGLAGEELSCPENEPHGAGEELLCLFMEEYLLAEPAGSVEARHEQTPGTGAQVVSKYIQAKAVPKLGGHDAPRLPIPVADEPTNAAAKELLKLISTFQMRLKEKNPLKAKQKLRFVTGLKQCLNSVKAGNVRLLLLAPNTEANEAVDEKIGALIDEAQRREVPLCYCLSKRILGKAAQLSMKQSAVAILDPDGAYEYFKILVKFVSPVR